MSKRTVALENQQADVDMTPMLDIVFIMLIFFIVSTSFLQTTGFDVLRPLSKAPTNAPAPAIVVQITERGGISINGRVVDVADFNANHQVVVSVMNQIKTIEELAISVVSKG
jgi:biopolymer transport protein ExbD